MSNGIDEGAGGVTLGAGALALTLVAPDHAPYLQPGAGLGAPYAARPTA